MEGHLTTGYFLVYRLLAMLLDSWHQQQREISINISLKNKKPWKVYVQMLFYQMWNLEVNFYCILYCYHSSLFLPYYVQLDGLVV